MAAGKLPLQAELGLYDLPTSLKGGDVADASQLEPLTLEPPKGTRRMHNQPMEVRKIVQI